MKFSIITVSYNPGGKLKETLLSIAAQSCTDYEVIVKDGGSTDGSADFLREAQVNESAGEGTAQEDVLWHAFLRRVRFFEGKDAGIYDAMNRAAALAQGEYILFLNCGDTLADETVLERTAAVMGKTAGKVMGNAAETKEAAMRYIFYGDTVSRQTKATIVSPPRINGFACYRNIPCHQSCFYGTGLCRAKPYDLQYRIRADYDHFLWCFYRGGAAFVPLGFPVSAYEGGGYSENAENAAQDRAEHKAITSAYMSGFSLFCYRFIMILTLAPFRSKLAQSKIFSGIYHRLKSVLYGRA